MLSCCTFISVVSINVDGGDVIGTKAVDVDCSATAVEGEDFIDIGVVGGVVLVGVELNIS